MRMVCNHRQARSDNLHYYRCEYELKSERARVGICEAIVRV